MTSGTTNDLAGVWGSSFDDVYAVGDSATVLHYTNSTWSNIDVSALTTQNLNAVWGTGASDVFAAGNSGTILHYDGSTWTPMNSGITEHLRGVWGTGASDVFAVGASGTILHSDCRQMLTWIPDFTGATGKDTYIMVFQATGSLGWGLHSIIPVFEDDGGTRTAVGATATIASAMYNIIIKAGEQTIQAVIAITADGEVKLISYQVLS